MKPGGGEGLSDWRGGLVDEAIEELMRLGDDDPLRAPPVGPRPLLLDPRPDLLPIHELTPEDFERLLLRVVEEVEGLREVHLYGVPGQRQDGLDGIGFDPAGRPVGFQAKRYLVFAARDLIDAVDAYTSGRRRIRVVRLLIGVATEVRRTEILNELTAQRANHPELEIELYDRRRLSDLMRDRPDIVRRFFGDAAAERFCLGLTGEAPSATGPPLDAVALADAVMRGPGEAAGMAEALAYADRQRDKHSEKAADAYLGVEQALEKRRFGSHAFLVRQRRAAALRAAGRLDESAGLLGDSVWLYLHRGDVDEARIALHQLDELVGPQRPAAQKPSGTPSLVSGQTQLLHQVLEASVTLVQDPIDRMSSLGEVVDELLTARHLYAGRVAVLFAETALAAADRATFGARMLALAVDPTSRAGTGESSSMPPPTSWVTWSRPSGSCSSSRRSLSPRATSHRAKPTKTVNKPTIHSVASESASVVATSGRSLSRWPPGWPAHPRTHLPSRRSLLSYSGRVTLRPPIMSRWRSRSCPRNG